MEYHIQQPALTIWEKTVDVASSQISQQVTPLGIRKTSRTKGDSLLGIVRMGLLENEDRSKTQTDVFFHVYCDSSEMAILRVYKSVKKGESVWLWGPHNPFGLFEFATEWTEEPRDSPYTESMRRIIGEIVRQIASGSVESAMVKK